jgi:hypothetical protein
VISQQKHAADEKLREKLKRVDPAELGKLIKIPVLSTKKPAGVPKK